MSKGTIIYIGGFELPDKNAAALRVMANAKIFERLGYSTVFIGIEKGEANNKDVSKKMGGFTCWEVPYPKGYKEWVRYLISIDAFIKVFSKYNDVKAVICYNYQTIALERVRRYCKKNKVMLISDCTEWYGESEGNIAFKVIKYLDTTVRMKISNKKVDSLIVASNYLQNYYKFKKTIIIPTLISMEHLKDSNFSDNRTIQFIYAGVPFRLGRPLKNRRLAKDRLDITIEILYKVYLKGKKFRFDIYGITKEQYLEALPNDFEILDKLKHNIYFHGRRSNEEIRNHIRAADFTLLIRDDNRMTKAGFPTKFTESLNCSIPVITTNTSDLSSYLVEGKNGFFVDMNKRQSAEDKISKILSLDSSQINKMKEYCYKTHIFDLENWVEVTKKFFEKNIGD